MYGVLVDVSGSMKSTFCVDSSKDVTVNQKKNRTALT